MTGSRKNLHRDKVREYVKMRIDMLVQERAKNQDEVAHMVIDKCVGELCYVLELMEREIEHKDR
jgi:Mg2+ and Co2+ transporter CorA